MTGAVITNRIKLPADVWCFGCAERWQPLLRSVALDEAKKHVRQTGHSVLITYENQTMVDPA